jgi:UDPglucose 6-dehydrogenase
LIKDFQSEKALVNVYDPQVEHEQIWADLQEASPLVPLDGSMCLFFMFNDGFLTNRTVKKQVTICKSALEACKNAEAVVIATEWKEFKEIDWEAVYAGMNKPAFVFDGRLLVDAEKLTKIGFKVCLVFDFIDLRY